MSLPRVHSQDLDHLSKKKQGAKAKRFTLFKIVRLDSPSDRFGRTDGDRHASGWTLGQRIQVRGHFRWQAYGPQHGQRRLQWIKAYEKGPIDGEQKLPLIRPVPKQPPVGAFVYHQASALLNPNPPTGSQPNA